MSPAPKRGPGRPANPETRRIQISLKVDPEVLTRIREIAEEHGIGYQTFINDLLSARARKGTR